MALCLVRLALNAWTFGLSRVHVLLVFAPTALSARDMLSNVCSPYLMTKDPCGTISAADVRCGKNMLGSEWQNMRGLAALKLTFSQTSAASASPQNQNAVHFITQDVRPV